MKPIQYIPDNERRNLMREIKSWLADFHATQPGNLDIDSDTFEGGAFYLLAKVLDYLQKH